MQFQQTGKKIRILIAEDHTLVRQAWISILNNDPRFQVIADTADDQKALELARQLKPDVILLDIHLGEADGIRIIPMLRQNSPESAILGVSAHSDPAYAKKMMETGALGYVTKNSPGAELLLAITEVNEGRKYICEEIRNILSDRILHGNKSETGITRLSQREMEVIEAIVRGNSSKEIGNMLLISTKTVEVHRYNIMRKLGLKNVASLVSHINKYRMEFEGKFRKPISKQAGSH